MEGHSLSTHFVSLFTPKCSSIQLQNFTHRLATELRAAIVLDDLASLQFASSLLGDRGGTPTLHTPKINFNKQDSLPINCHMCAHPHSERLDFRSSYRSQPKCIQTQFCPGVLTRYRGSRTAHRSNARHSRAWYTFGHPGHTSSAMQRAAAETPTPTRRPDKVAVQMT